MKHLGLTLSYLVPTATLLGMSLLILNSVSPASAKTQLVVILIGTGLFLILSRIDYQLYLFSPWPWYVTANLLLILTFLVGNVTRGSIRWINIAGMSLQTSEFAKPLLILFIAGYLAQHVPRSLKAVITYCLLMTVPMVLIYLQPDLGSALLIMVIIITSLISAGVSFRHLAVLALIFICVVPAVYLNLKPYQIERLQSFVNPRVDPLGSGYNALQATIAVGSGQLFGRGLGQGTQSHLRFLPERQTDFIYASLVEELGFLAGLIVILCYLWLAAALIISARKARTDVGSIICLTALSLLLAQVLINMGMNMGIIPVTGITLPLISAGGSSLISFSIILGICYSIAAHPSAKRPLLEIR